MKFVLRYAFEKLERKRFSKIILYLFDRTFHDIFLVSLMIVTELMNSSCKANEEYHYHHRDVRRVQRELKTLFGNLFVFRLLCISGNSTVSQVRYFCCVNVVMLYVATYFKKAINYRSRAVN